MRVVRCEERRDVEWDVRRLECSDDVRVLVRDVAPLARIEGEVVGMNNRVRVVPGGVDGLEGVPALPVALEDEQLALVLGAVDYVEQLPHEAEAAEFLERMRRIGLQKRVAPLLARVAIDENVVDAALVLAAVA